MSRPLPAAPAYDFGEVVARHGVDLGRLPLETLQLNLTRLCNQACHHCHVDASPKRTEQMDRRTAERCLELLATHRGLGILDLTGGAPELNPQFEFLVREARRLGKRVMVRHNLTVTLDGNPQTGASMEHLPNFFAEQQVEVVSSLPFYAEYFTDKQRGKGVFDKSIESMRRLNAVGYGAGEGLSLTLVYNPVGSYFPPEQGELQADYKRILGERFGVRFDALFTITNMPINRFRAQLERKGGYADYMRRLVDAFNPQAAEGVMCRSLISVDWEGRLYDCDFNQMLGMPIEGLSVFELDPERLPALPIRTGEHCFGCTAGAGSSCGGTTT